MAAYVVHSSDWKRPLAVIELDDGVVEALSKYGSVKIPSISVAFNPQLPVKSSLIPHDAVTRGLVLRAVTIKRHSASGREDRSSLFIHLNNAEDVDLLYGAQHAMLTVNYGKLNQSAFGRHILEDLKRYSSSYGVCDGEP